MNEQMLNEIYQRLKEDQKKIWQEVFGEEPFDATKLDKYLIELGRHMQMGVKRKVAEWISVQESLPPEGEIVLVNCNTYLPDDEPLCQKRGNWIFLARFYRYDGWIVYYFREARIYVTHWMKRPDDPAE